MTNRRGLLDRLERGGLPRASPETPVAQSLNPRDAVRLVQRKILESHPALLGNARLQEDGRQKLRDAVQNVVATESLAMGKVARDALTDMVVNEISGMGPIEPLLQDPDVTEIMVNAFDEVWVERCGRIERSPVSFKDQEQVLEIISRAIAPLGRRVDQSVPYVDGRLPDGSRLHACISPVSLKGPVMTIRKFPKGGYSIEDIVRFGTLTPEAADFLKECVVNRLNIIIAGGTGSGKTSTLNALLGELRNLRERVITIEDCAELCPLVENVVVLESRPPNIEGKGEITIRTLVRNALRMRPDRIIVGEARGPEAFDMLQAMNTGHQGSMSTVHANGPEDALKRLEGMALMAPEVPDRVVKELIPSAVDLVVFQRRLPSGERKVTDICLMSKERGRARWELIPVFSAERSAQGEWTLVRTTADLPQWYTARASWNRRE